MDLIGAAKNCEVSSPEYPQYGQPPGGQVPPPADYPASPFQQEYTVPPVYGDTQYPPAPEYPGPAYPASGAPAYQQYTDPGQQYAPPPQPTTPYPAPQQPVYPPPTAPYGAPQPAWGAPAPPPKKSKAPLIIVLVVAIVLVLGCGGIVTAIALSGDDNKTPSTASSSQGTVPTKGSSSAPTSSSTHDSDLTTYLLEAPSDSTPWVTAPDDEILDLSDAADFGADSSVWRDLLTSDGFLRGISRHWKTADGDLVEIDLFQFSKPSGATSFFSSVSDATGGSTDWSSGDTVSGTNGGQVFLTYDTDDNGYLTALGMGHIGDVFVNITVSAKPPLDTGSTEDLLKQQCGKL